MDETKARSLGRIISYVFNKQSLKLLLREAYGADETKISFETYGDFIQTFKTIYRKWFLVFLKDTTVLDNCKFKNDIAMFDIYDIEELIQSENIQRICGYDKIEIRAHALINKSAETMYIDTRTNEFRDILNRLYNHDITFKRFMSRFTRRITTEFLDKEKIQEDPNYIYIDYNTLYQLFSEEIDAEFFRDAMTYQLDMELINNISDKDTEAFKQFAIILESSGAPINDSDMFKAYIEEKMSVLNFSEMNKIFNETLSPEEKQDTVKRNTVDKPIFPPVMGPKDILQ